MKANRTVLVGAVLALGMGACAHQPGMRAAKKPDPKVTNVYVDEGMYLVVDQEPIRIPKNQKNFDLTWQLAADPRYTFPANGIEIVDPDGNFERCKPHPKGNSITCKFKGADRKQGYKYTIRVEDNGKPLEPLDPFIVNY